MQLVGVEVFLVEVVAAGVLIDFMGEVVAAVRVVVAVLVAVFGEVVEFTIRCVRGGLRCRRRRCRDQCGRGR